MKRRSWPIALAVATLVVFGSYLAYTQYLVRMIREQTNLHTSVYSLVQREMNSPPGEQEYLTALADMQQTLARLDPGVS